MKNLRFKRLTIGSDTIKAANQFTFKPRFNLITGNDNSIGKSTLVKLLLWTVGAEPEFDFTWKSFDVRALVDFNIGTENFQAGRHGNTMFLKRPNAQWERFSKITGDYSRAFAEIVGFAALLPNRNDATKLETPPPAFYFLPFYVDQQLSWSQAWQSFPSLEQYARWQKVIIEYHTGYLSPQHFEKESQIARSNITKRAAESEVKKIETAIEVVKAYIPTAGKTLALTAGEFDALAEEVNIGITQLQSAQEALFKSIAEIQTERMYLEGQLQLASLASKDLEKDYIFSVENVVGETVLCPLCGNVHDNSLPNRASILADKDEADKQAKSLTEKIALLDKRLVRSQDRLDDTKAAIEELNNKYKVNEPASEKHAETEAELFSFFDSLSSRAVQKHVSKSMEAKTALIREIKRTNRLLRTEQKKLLTKEDREAMDADFRNNLSKYVADLKATGVNLAPVESPLDYKKLHGSGGAAESTRGLLAYYMAILRQIATANSEVFSAMIVDTPNQHEQADFNYEKILQFLMTSTPPDAQLILCAMHRKEVESFKGAANVIELDEERILKSSKYDEFRTMLDFENIT